MYSISDELRQRFEQGEKKSVLITLKNHQYGQNDPLEITEADIVSNSLSIDRYCITGNKIEIGSAVSAELSLAINNNSGKFDNVTFEGAELFVKIGIAGVADSYVPCGKFTVDEPPRNKRRINIKALDFMMLFDNTASVGNLSFETPEKLVKSICNMCSVTLSNKVDFSNFANTFKALVTPTTEVTYRQLLQWVCQILGVCAYFDGDGELMLSWYTDAKDESGNKVKIDTTTRYSGDAYENDIEITGVVIKTADKDITSGLATNALVIENNQLLDSADKNLKTVADNIWDKIEGFEYRPYECSCMPMPYIFPLDKIVYKDQSDNEIATIVTHHNFGLNGASALAAKGETEQQRGYAKSKGVTKDEINAAIAEAMKGVDLKTDHFHVKYSAYPDGKDPDTGEPSWSGEPEANSVYIGTCVTDSASVPDSPEDYNWIKIKGEDGKTPVKDVDYFDGATLQVKYKSSSTKPTISNNNVSGWDDTVPIPLAGQRVYMTQKLSTETNWSTPIQISAEDGTTPTVSISTDGYWIINGEKTGTKAQGEKPTITVGANGNWYVDGKDSGTKAQGEQGKDGADIEYVYYRSQTAVSNLARPSYTSGKLPDGWTTSPQGITETNKYEYVSVRTKTAGSSTWGEFSTPVIWSKWGEKGTDGDGIEYKYYLSNSADKPTYSASDNNWTDEPIGVSASNMYEYVVQITHHGDGTTTLSDDVALWAKWGADGKGISSITEYYYASDDSTVPPASVQVAPFNYSMSVAGVSKTNTSMGYSLGGDGYYAVNMNSTNNAYILMKLTFAVTKATDIILKCINYAEYNYDYMLVSKISTNQNDYKFSTGAVTTDDPKYAEKNFKTLHSANPVDIEYKNVSVGTHYVYIKVYKDGSTTEDYETFKFKAVEKSEWPTTIPSDYGSDKPYLWNYTKTIYTDGDSESSAPAIISYYGGKGDPGVGISSIQEFYLCNNSPNLPTSKDSFADYTNKTPPQPNATNQYLWNYEKINYTEGDPKETQIRLVCVFGKDGKTPVKGTDYFDGVGISSTTIQYASGTSGVSAPSSGWQDAIPSVANGSYLWTKIILAYTNGTQKISYSVSRMGEDGEDAQSLYANCASDASDQVKYATLSVGDISALEIGTTVSVKFANGNSYAAPYFYLLRSSGTGIGSSSYQIRPRGYLPSSSQPFTWDAGVVLTLELGTDNYWYVIDEANTSSKMTKDGLVVGNWSGSTLKNNVLIGPDSVDIRNNSTVYASYGADSIELGKNSPEAAIKLCSGIAEMAVQNVSGSVNENNFSFDYFSIEVPKGSLWLGSGDTTYIKASSSNDSYTSDSEIEVDGSGLYGDITLRSTFTDRVGTYTPLNERCTAEVDIQPRVGKIGLYVYYPGKSSTSLTVDGANEEIDIDGDLSIDGDLFINGTKMIAGWCPEEILYNGGATNDIVSLSKDVVNYNYIEIFFQDSNGEFGGYTKLYKPNGKTALLSINQPAESSTYIRSTRITIDGKTITPDTSNSNCIAITTGNKVSKVGYNQIYITRVVGIY